MLTPFYDNNVVSGKSWGKSIRYHYQDGKFKGLNEESRVIFIDYEKDYESKLKENFRSIVKYEVKEVKV